MSRIEIPVVLWAPAAEIAAKVVKQGLVEHGLVGLTLTTANETWPEGVYSKLATGILSVELVVKPEEAIAAGVAELNEKLRDIRAKGAKADEELLGRINNLLCLEMKSSESVVNVEGADDDIPF